MEVIKCVETFLDMRRVAIPIRATQPAPSQNDNEDDDDEFGMFDFDITDPHLNKLLGAEIEDDPIMTQDKDVAHIIKSSISPAIYKLLSDIHIAAEDGHCPAAQRPFYVRKLIDCWAGCAQVLIQNDLTVSVFSISSIQSLIPRLGLVNVYHVRLRVVQKNLRC